MIVYIAGVNQLNDVEIDKINKPYLPLASGDFSMEAGIAITSAALSMSLVMGIMLSPALFSGMLMFVLNMTMHAIDVPQSIDLNNKASTTSFYLFIWQLYSVGCFLALFVR
ncbi:hypothetical protein SLEP1_g1752 [Rubroshorea leprosula]|uniref:Uncharacterized protein n=1 Tax=Rubroshorea leprosula TaxID=152421 RepID=A0AAV5HQP5_9ROSI|nr:hypothetical protein SLEP1_g1752 [Rubroshorea leprosula]